jgi:glycosyltransferase involved in cell wall biosynthesis
MGGAPRVVFQMADHLAQRGHSVTVLAGDHGAQADPFPAADFQTVLLPCISSRWGFYFSPSMDSWLRDHVPEYDIVHLHIARTYQNIIALRHAIRARVPIVVSAHGTLPAAIERQSAKKIYDWFFGRSLMESAARWIAVSPAEVDQYRQAGIRPDKIRLVMNGLDLREFARLPKRGLFRAGQPGLNANARVILFLGRLHRRKGIRHLIKAFSQLRSEYPDCVMIIAGPDDGEQSALAALTKQLQLEKEIRFVGPLYGPERLKALVDADVLVSPATQEIFGLVPFEALLCGTPVIAGEDCGGGQLIREAKAGYEVPYGDEDALAQMLRRVFQHPAEARARARAGRAFIRKSMKWTKNIIDLERIYREIR